jgi:hypothetical protein
LAATTRSRAFQAFGATGRDSKVIRAVLPPQPYPCDPWRKGKVGYASSRCLLAGATTSETAESRQNTIAPAQRCIEQFAATCRGGTQSCAHVGWGGPLERNVERVRRVTAPRHSWG